MKNGSPDENTSAVADPASSTATRSGAECFPPPAIPVDTSPDWPSGSINTASMPSHTSSSAWQIALRAALGSVVRGSRRATSATAVRSAAYWYASTSASCWATLRSVTSRITMMRASPAGGIARSVTSSCRSDPLRVIPERMLASVAAQQAIQLQALNLGQACSRTPS